MWTSVFFNNLQNRYFTMVLFDKRVNSSETLKASFGSSPHIYIESLSYLTINSLPPSRDFWDLELVISYFQTCFGGELMN